ncbi:MAG: DUF2332 family protein [Hyphomicrobiales bacterium]|nr:MAG: DUF2332 family protein [Hyphomicrobiales bacterium]
MSKTELVLKQFADQAAACEELGSPFTARLCQILARRLDDRSRFGRRILQWEGDPYADNVALRACGAVHALARSGWEPNLTRAYPPNPTSENAVWAALADALHHNDAFLTDRLSSAPQTNEVARSGLILGGMLTIAEVTGLPLEIFEIGASAGLNLGFDQYRYDFGGGQHWGRANAPLTIDCSWRGGQPPLKAPLSVTSRQGCDLNPLDPNRHEDRERLLSYIWADQVHRLERTEAALNLAAAEHRRADKADAVDWLADRLGAAPRRGVTRVLLHTIVWPYIPTASKQAIEATISRVSSAATADAPFARLSIEPDDTPGSARIDLTVWPSGGTVTLGRGDFHGRWAQWA